MAEKILDKQIIVLLLGVFTAVGVLSKCIVNLTLKRLLRAAANMGKSEHPLMRLVRAKFEHACMVNESVENVGVFVDKYLYSYRVFGVRLHSIRRLENAAALCCIAVGLAGSMLAYSVYGMNDLVLRTGAVGAGLGVLVFVFHLTTDEGYRMRMTRNYMVDYLENVCLRKYLRAYQRDAAQPQRPRPGREVPSPQGAPEVSEPETAPEVPDPATGPEISKPGTMPGTVTGRQQEPADILEMPSQIEAVEMLEEDYEEIAAAIEEEKEQAAAWKKERAAALEKEQTAALEKEQAAAWKKERAAALEKEQTAALEKEQTAAWKKAKLAEEDRAKYRSRPEEADPAVEKEIRIRRILEEFMA